jgi:hypothetical protein
MFEVHNLIFFKAERVCAQVPNVLIHVERHNVTDGDEAHEMRQLNLNC